MSFWNSMVGSSIHWNIGTLRNNSDWLHILVEVPELSICLDIFALNNGYEWSSDRYSMTKCSWSLSYRYNTVWDYLNVNCNAHNCSYIHIHHHFHNVHNHIDHFSSLMYWLPKLSCHIRTSFDDLKKVVVYFIHKRVSIFIN